MWEARVARQIAEGRRSPGTMETYRSRMQVHVLPALGALRLREINTPLLDRFVISLVDQVGYSTARTCRSIVSGVLGLAVRYGAIPWNPIRDVERVEGRAVKEPRALTAAERQTWFEFVDADPAASRRDLPDLSRFLLATGARIGEALALQWADVDLEIGSVSITHTVIRVKGAGLLRKGTKSRSGVRLLLLPDWGSNLLRSRFCAGIPPTRPVFGDVNGALRDPSNVRADLREAARAADLPWVTSHNFRKTTATLLDEAGLSARLIADQLGHARPSITQDVYMGRKAISHRVANALDAAGPATGRAP